MNDIGFVQYSKNTSQGMDARWHYWKDGAVKSGTGIVKGKLGSSFTGDFQVTYFDHHGIETSSFQLRIYNEGDHYIIEWLTNGIVEYIGTGILLDNILFAGWRKISL